VASPRPQHTRSSRPVHDCKLPQPEVTSRFDLQNYTVICSCFADNQSEVVWVQLSFLLVKLIYSTNGRMGENGGCVREPFYVGKFMVHGCDRKCREFLCKFPQ
jgi:hypothetical protein